MKKSDANQPSNTVRRRRERASNRVLNPVEVKKPVAFRLPASLVEQIEAMAARRGVDRSALLHQLLERGFLAESIAELTAKALDKISASQHSYDALIAMLEDLADRLEAVENAVKK